MIKQSFFIFLLLIVGYAVFIRGTTVQTSEAKTMWQYNQIKAERFIFGKHHQPVDVLLGTSLSKAFKVTAEGQAFINLSLIGKSVYEGLEIIRRSEAAPRTVFIEVNMVLNRSDNNFVNGLFNPVTHTVKRHMPFTRAEYNTTSVLYNQWMSDAMSQQYDPWQQKQNASNADYQRRQRQKEEVAVQFNLEEYSEGVSDIELLEKKVDQLKEYMQMLKDRGTTVVFYELPMHTEVCQQEYFLWARRLIHTYFPEHNYISQPTCAEYQTTDGLHLKEESTRQYLKYFVHELSKSSPQFHAKSMSFDVMPLLGLE